MVLFIDEIHRGGRWCHRWSHGCHNLLKPMLAWELPHRCHHRMNTASTSRKTLHGASLPAGAGGSTHRGRHHFNSARPEERYEVHHGVRIADSALVAAAVLSTRFIADRFLPDKAIDLVDESAARLKMEITSNRRRSMKSIARFSNWR